MPPLPVVTGPELIKVLEKQGSCLARVRGSHHVMQTPDRCGHVVVPVHGSRDLPVGTLRGILRSAGMSVDDLVQHL